MTSSFRKMVSRSPSNIRGGDNITSGVGFSSYVAPSVGDIQGNIFKEVRQLSRGKSRSYSWYRDTVRMISAKSDIYKTLSTCPDTLIPSGGKLYFFEYNATWARKLKYYDEFPLVYMLQGGPKFFGANLHYLTYAKRVQVIESILNGTPTIPKQCFHNYVYEGLDTPLFEINTDDWKTAIFIPNESFVTRRRGLYQRVSKSFVWGDSSQ
jgi:hypothetical protein